MRFAATALAAAVRAACASMTPALPVPDPGVADRYPASQPDIEPGASAAGLDWQSAFGDPRLRALIDLALANNRDLRTAILRVEEARAIHGIQRAEGLPTIGVSAEGGRSRGSGDSGPTGEPVTGSQYQVGLGLAAWELDLWGRVRSLEQAALQQYLATEEARRAVAQAVVTQVAQGYLALRELDERLVLAQSALDSRNESLRIFTRRHEVGAASKFELAQVRTLSSQARSLVAQLQQQRAAQANALVQLVGTPVDLAPSQGALEDAAVVVPLSAGLPSALLLQRPDILAAEHRLRAANANIGAARAAFFPRITLTGSAGWASRELDGLFESRTRTWSFLPSLSLPLFDGGGRRASLDLAEVRRDLAVADYERVVQAAFREVADALGAQQWLDEQVQAQAEALEAQAERARLARLRYDAGAAAFLEVLDAQRDLLTAQQQLVQARRATLASRTALYAALGGGAGALPGGLPSPSDR